MLVHFANISTWSTFNLWICEVVCFRVESTELLNLQTQNGSLSQNLNPVFNVPNQTLLQNLSHITSPNQNFTYSISLPNQTTPYLNDSSDVSVTPQQVDMLMKTYLVAITMFITGISLFGLAYFRMSVSISKQLHNTMFKIVLGAKTYFFDSNPVGECLQLTVHQCLYS